MSNTPTTPSFPAPPSPLGQGSRPHTPPMEETHSMLPTSPSPRNPFSSGRSSRAAPSDEGSNYGLASAGAGLGGSLGTNRGSMVLYRLADDPPSTGSERDSVLVPPRFTSPHSRSSTFSLGAASARSSMISFSDDSKYPFAMASAGQLNRESQYIFKERGLVPYSYDPSQDMSLPPDEEDILHDPKTPTSVVIARFSKTGLPWRGMLNAGMLVVILGALLALFVAYPVVDFVLNEGLRSQIAANVRVNGTGQAAVLFQVPELIDRDTPESAKRRQGLSDSSTTYELVFSDEFNAEGRTFYPGDDPFWEAVDIWYGVTGDLEWYDPSQVTTHDGSLLITMDSTNTTQAGITPGSTAPFTAAENHELGYRSGMLQSWNKFCFTAGYIEVRVLLPGPDANAAGYWPGAWTMGNLGRPGYTATTDGVWPYTYDTCDTGTFRNQTFKDGSGPAGAKFSEASSSRFHDELSWLSGQKLSACSCPNSDHPGPIREGRYVGRGAPEIDIFEASVNKETLVGATVSQSSQFAPFSADYLNINGTAERQVFTPERARINKFLGSGVQQSVSAIVDLPNTMFHERATSPYTAPTKDRFVTFGFEYEPHAEGGYIMWQIGDRPTHRAYSSSIPADPSVDIGQRLVSVEPMAIILNMGISPNWQKINHDTLAFPAEFRVDYVRVYQRAGAVNIGCDPKEYPTGDYIRDHLSAYQDPNVTTWQWERPRNGLWEGGC